MCEIEPGSGTCTLRAAVQEANATDPAFPVVISLDGAATYQLTLVGIDAEAAVGDLDTTRSVTIEGNGATIRGATPAWIDSLALFEHFGGTLDVRDATLEAMAENPISSGVVERKVGSVLLNHADAKFADVTMSGYTNQNAAIQHEGENLVLERTRVVNSSTSGSVIAVLSGTAFLVDSELSSNLSTLFSTTLDVVYVAPDATAFIVRSTIAGNSGSFSCCFPIRTIFYAGAALDVDGHVVVVRSTILDPIDTIDPSGVTDVSASILYRCFAPVTSHGYNRDDNGTCLDGSDPTDVTDASSVVGPLGFNGGSTRTALPLAGTSVIDAIPWGTPMLCDGTLATDQRGMPIADGSPCDRGAVERQPSDP